MREGRIVADDVKIEELYHKHSVTPLLPPAAGQSRDDVEQRGGKVLPVYIIQIIPAHPP